MTPILMTDHRKRLCHLKVEFESMIRELISEQETLEVKLSTLVAEINSRFEYRITMLQREIDYINKQI